MLAGYLHIDASRGLTAPMLGAAMAGLLPSLSNLKDDLLTFGISLLIDDEERGALRGKTLSLEFYGQPLKPFHQDPSRLKINAEGLHPFIKRCLLNDDIALEAMQEHLQNLKLNPLMLGIALKTLDCMKSNIFSAQNLYGQDALWLFAHVIVLTKLLNELDPKLLSASSFSIGKPNISSDFSKLALNNDLWVKETLKLMPVIEVAGEVKNDVLAVAFVRSLAGFLGPRASFSIIKNSLGFEKNNLSMVEASWCELALPDTIKELGPSNKPVAKHLFEINAVFAPISDMPSLISLLALHRAKCMSYHLVSRENNQSAYSLKFLIEQEYKHKALEALLIKGAAIFVTERVVEHHELNKRLVTIPLGHGNKTNTARLYEYIFLDKCIRVEPLEEDLEAYVKRTDYSVDVARSDLLMAWKKWRGKLVDEDHDETERKRK